MKSGNIKLSALFGPPIAFVKRYHTLLFFLLVSVGLFGSILLIMSVVSMSSNTASTSDQTVSGLFDEHTIQQIKQDSSVTTQPSGRRSPFVEN
jgi:hypothetical protein